MTDIPNAPRWVLVTPAMALIWLTTNTINRHVRPRWVAYLTAQIRNHTFYPTGDAISFRDDGVLINGQHRLMAIVEADMPATLLVVGNLPEQTFVVTDRNISRTARDVLKLPNALLADANMIGRMLGMTLKHRMSEFEQRDIATWWSPAYHAIVKNVSYSRGFSSASFRVGFGARWAIQSSDEARDYVVDQFRYMQAGDVTQMTLGVATLWKRANRERSDTMSYGHRDAFAAIAYYHAEPSRAVVAPYLRVMKETLDELHRVLAVMEAAFIAAPKDAGHPYLFDRAHRRQINPVRVRVRERGDDVGDDRIAPRPRP